ncbi:MAG: hypothetical protein FK730_04530 [Asgard group archaeon]|nr:hypothetical protein [Asgard group archaeon]
MKVWIIHNSKHGNGKKVAETIGKDFEKKMDVNISHVKDVTPKQLVDDLPDILVVGTQVMAFMTNSKSKGFIRGLKGQLKKANKTIKYGISFLTHAMPTNGVSFQGKRFNKILGKTVTNVYPEWLSGRVASAEGPLMDGVIEEIQNKCKDILTWIK